MRCNTVQYGVLIDMVLSKVLAWSDMRVSEL